MHEMSITRSIIKIIGRELEKNRMGRLLGLKLRVGELTAVEPGALRFCFEACTKGTNMEGAELDIEEVPLIFRCGECEREFRAEGFTARCPFCSGAGSEALTGRELDIVSMEAV